jgi:hypothetical protein
MPDRDDPPIVQPINPHAGALWAIGRGIPVLPLKPGSKVVFSLEKGDDPFLSGGVNIATLDKTVVDAWFAHNRDINYGLRMGGPQRLVGLDGDTSKPTLWEEYNALEYPRTLEMVSARGGCHIIFRVDFEAGQKNLAGAEAFNIKAEGGYLVGPGSVFEGKRYRIHDDAPIADCPPAIAARISKRGEKAAAKSAAPLCETDTAAAMRDGWEVIAKTPPLAESEGIGRNNKTHHLAGRLKRLGLSEGTCAELVLHWNATCLPPQREEDVRKTVASSYKGDWPIGADRPEAEFENIADCPIVKTAAEWHARQGPQGPQGKAKADIASRFIPIDVTTDPADLPKRPWLIIGDVLRCASTGLVAPGGVGKSALTIGVAVGLAANTLDFLKMEIKPGGPYRTMLIATEDDLPEVQKRIASTCILNDIDRLSLQNKLWTYVDPECERFMAMTKNARSDKMEPTPELIELEKFIVRERIDLIVWDPLAELHEGNENSNTDLNAVMKALRRIAFRTNAAGIVCHHSRKAMAGMDYEPGNADIARGGSVYRANVRGMWTMLNPTEAACEELGIPVAEQRSYVRLDTGKVQYGPNAGHPRWYRLHSVQIGNGESAVALRYIPLKTTEKPKKESRLIEVLRKAIETAFDNDYDSVQQMFIELYTTCAKIEDRKTQFRKVTNGLPSDIKCTVVDGVERFTIEAAYEVKPTEASKP